ncbi:hypothetical protein HOI18_01035 [Candidatus Uhrbacteria bacterium]|jgi:hypothetical protein|nr:hypothetical protein [Candidatus Uhrbacteria bacterium]
MVYVMLTIVVPVGEQIYAYRFSLGDIQEYLIGVVDHLEQSWFTYFGTDCPCMSIRCESAEDAATLVQIILASELRPPPKVFSLHDRVSLSLTNSLVREVAEPELWVSCTLENEGVAEPLLIAGCNERAGVQLERGNWVTFSECRAVLFEAAQTRLSEPERTLNLIGTTDWFQASAQECLIATIFYAQTLMVLGQFADAIILLEREIAKAGVENLHVLALILTKNQVRLRQLLTGEMIVSGVGCHNTLERRIARDSILGEMIVEIFQSPGDHRELVSLVSLLEDHS